MPDHPRRSSLRAVRRRSSLAEFCLDANASPTQFSELQQKVGLGMFQFTTLPALLGIFLVEGAEMLATNEVAAGVADTFDLSELQRGRLTSSAMGGMVLGCFLSGVVCDGCGRRCAVLLAYLGMVLFGSSSLLAIGFYSLSAARLLNGFSCGLGIPAAFALSTEMLPKEYRAFAWPAVLAAISTGEVYAGLGAAVWMPDLVGGNWQALTIFCTLPSLVFLLAAALLLEESPVWLASNGRLDEAVDVILRMAERNRVAHHFEALRKARVTVEPGANPSHEPEGPQRNPVAVALRSPSVQGNIAVCSLLAITGNTLVFGMSYFWTRTLAGSETRSHASKAMQLVEIRSWGFLASAVLAGVMASSVGHRTAISLLGLLTSANLLWLQSALAAEVPRLVVVGGVLMVTTTVMHTTMSSLNTETFPTEVRGFCVGLVVTIGKCSTILAPTFIERRGLSQFVQVAFCLAAMSTVLVWTLRETKALPLEDYVMDEADDERLPLLQRDDLHPDLQAMLSKPGRAAA